MPIITAKSFESGISMPTSVQFFKEFKDDYRDSNDEADLYKLAEAFTSGIQRKTEPSMIVIQNEFRNKSITQKVTIDTQSIQTYMYMSLREIKSKEELALLTKAVRISAMGQREIMKAMHPGMSETEMNS
jgi:Xaa-Pro aminopeptidase